MGGDSLQRLKLAGMLDLDSFIQLAITITEILGQIHQRHIIHKDVNPANIVLNPSTHQVKIIDFSISTVLSREKPTFRNPHMLEGTLTYMSPEQTGRMNRAMDYRTDFYSLGVTLYEMLTGQLPFTSDDMLELVHSHIARQPVPPHEMMEHGAADDTQTIQSLSQVILKLMAKNAEDRYQSAYGIKADLEQIREQRATSKNQHPVSLFVPGMHDISDRFSIPQKLYGRDWEVEDLLSAFDRVCRGSSELMLVTGAPGIGKTALVQEVHKPITRQRGYFIAGKFDQFQRNIPYSAFIQAFRSLVLHLLTESEERVEQWRTDILESLGTNGQVLIEVIPEVELIIGPQPDPPDLGPAESQNRFTLLFQRFTAVFASSEHPLVLFLDDLQWADTASLKLLELLLTDTNSRYLFLIGAYRDAELDASHPLRLTVQAITHADVAVNDLRLDPLTVSDIATLLADTLHCAAEQVGTLADLLVVKTDGNPFFLNEFLKTLYVDELLRFEGSGWTWDIDQIQARQMTDNVVELMASNVLRIAAQTQDVLKRAACIGNQFDLATLALVSESSPGDTARDLEEALREGFVIPLGESYKLMALDVPGLTDSVTAEYIFAHDRIRQAVYSLIPEAEQQATHWRIGMAFLNQCETAPPDDHHATLEERIFDIVNQLNQGQTICGVQLMCKRLAELNLLAGQRAKASAAYEPSYAYLKTGLSLLEDDAWQCCHDLALALHGEAAEAAYLCGNFEDMERLSQVALQHTSTLLETVKVYEVRILAAIAQNQLLQAVQTGLSLLNESGILLPEQPDTADFLAGLQEVTTALGGRPIESLADLPPMTDPHKLAVMRILLSLTSPAYLVTPQLAALISFKQVVLSLTYGNAPMSPFAYGMYGFILAGVLGDIETGHDYGMLALDLVEHPDSREWKTSTMHIVNAGVRHWKEPLAKTIPALLAAYQSGLETGDVQYAANAAYMYTVNSYLAGRNLVELAQEREAFSRTIAQLKQEAALRYHEIYRQVILNLCGQNQNEQNLEPCRIRGSVYDETVGLPKHLEAGDQTALHIVYSQKLVLAYLFYRYDDAMENATLAEQSVVGVTASPQVPYFYFYNSLARLAFAGRGKQGNTPDQQLEKVAANMEKLRMWAQHAPANHQHRCALIDAEQARVLGNDGEAREQYDTAIALAQKYGSIHEEALALELAGRFYLEKGLPDIADMYLRKARYAYQQWGAQTKVNDLENRYPSLRALAAQSSSGTTTITSTTQMAGASDLLDLNSVVKASQAISGEIVLDNLLSKLMDTAMENAGAQRGVLVLEQDGQWVIEAEGTIEDGELMTANGGGQPHTHFSTLHAHLPINNTLLPLSIIYYVGRTHKSVVLNDARKEGTFAQDTYIREHQPRSLLCSPLIHQGKLSGMIYLENNLTTEAFTQERIIILNILVSQAAISIQNARLYIDVQASERKYRTLFEESRDTIFITTPSGRIIDMSPSCQLLFGYTREEILHINIRDVYANPKDRDHIRHELERTGSVRDSEVVFRQKNGILRNCLITATVRYAEDGTIEYYQGIIRDITEQQQAERERLRLTAIERELTLALSIQKSLLPPERPAWDGLDVVCYTRPALEVGGDFYAYHVFESSPGEASKYVFAIGDVSGKGMPAALLMAVTMASFRSLVGQELAPGDFLARMDQVIAEYTSTTRQNCAFVYMELVSDMAPGREEGAQRSFTLRVANAGCLPPVIRRKDGTVEWIDAGGFPLGIGEGAKVGYLETSVVVNHGDSIILTSDGVVEAKKPGGDWFGFDRIDEAVAAGPSDSAEALLRSLRAEVETFVNGREPHDDMTIVVVRL